MQISLIDSQIAKTLLQIERDLLHIAKSLLYRELITAKQLK